jgi:hypothetical protein
VIHLQKKMVRYDCFRCLLEDILCNLSDGRWSHFLLSDVTVESVDVASC